MHYPRMIVVGSSIVGWLAIEALAALAALTKTRVPIMMNILGAIAGAMISGGFVL